MIKNRTRKIRVIIEKFLWVKLDEKVDIHFKRILDSAHLIKTGYWQGFHKLCEKSEQMMLENPKTVTLPD